MTGIERLRELADGVYRCHSVWSLTREEYEAEHGLSEKDNGGPLGDVLNDIADQIEREHTEDCFRMGERAAEGKVGPKTQHEMALSLLYDWERGAVERERARRLGIADDVSMSAYDLLPADERDAIAWVREHGGIAEVKKGWSGRVPTSSVKRMVESHKKRRDRLKAHALWLERKCHERKRLIVELNKLVGSYRAALNGVCERLGLTDGTGLPDMPEVIWAELDRRLMPEGMEWPRFEDGEPVCVGDEAPFGADGTLTVTGVELTGGGHFILHGRDGGIDRPCQTGYQCGQRVKRPAPKALDADGSEIREKCDAWWICEGDERGIHAERLSVQRWHVGKPRAVRALRQQARARLRRQAAARGRHGVGRGRPWPAHRMETPRQERYVRIAEKGWNVLLPASR